MDPLTVSVVAGALNNFLGEAASEAARLTELGSGRPKPSVWRGRAGCPPFRAALQIRDRS